MNHERFQTHCLVCAKVFEADSVAEVIKKAEEHEKLPHAKLKRNGRKTPKTTNNQRKKGQKKQNAD